MLDRQNGGVRYILGSILLMTLSLPAHAQTSTSASGAHSHPIRHQTSASSLRGGHGGRKTGHHGISGNYRGNNSHVRRTSYRVIQCVPFARAASGIALTGNAVTWWDEASGVYARGNVPEPGSVLAFRANRAMQLGHVAVVSRVINSREIEIDQAHWGQNGISRNIAVIDISPNNDWTAVRVALGHGGSFGSIYPTHGFIYPRAAESAAAPRRAAPSQTIALNPAPRDLRSPAEQRAIPVLAALPADTPGDNEVAEAPASAGSVAADAPDRNLR
jgi:surface antigen